VIRLAFFSRGEAMGAKIHLQVSEGVFVGKSYVFSEPTTCTIGRSDNCSVQFPNNPFFLDVSRRHCLLDIDPRPDPPEIHVRDLGSRNGTYINGTMIGRRLPDETRALSPQMPIYALHDGDELKVGGNVFRVCVSNDPPAHTNTITYTDLGLAI
jgi:pSer/pThr/pTyr-binding forkhead associated (FHA) protein